MKLKKFLRFVPIIFLILPTLFGCSNGNSGPHCTMTVETSYGGCGIDGQSLGSGSFVETFRVMNNDCFYEDFDGHWMKEPKDMSDEQLIIKICGIEEDGITAVINDKEEKISYSSDCNVSSKFIVCDGINYGYVISFSDYSE